MAISTDYRKKDVQKNVEKQLASVTAAYLRGYVKLAKGSGTMEVNPNVLKDSIIKYVAEVSKGTSLVELDAEGKPIEPNVFMDEEGIHINEYTLEVLPFEEFARGEYVNTVYDAIEEEHDYMAQILAQIKLADKMSKAKSKEPVEGESIIENANNARVLVYQEDAAKQIAMQEAYMVMGANLSRTITPTMLKEIGFTRADQQAVGRNGEAYGTRKEIESDLKIQCIQASNRAVEVMREEGFEFENISQENIDEIIRNNPSLVSKYPSLAYEYNKNGRPRSYKEAKEIIVRIRQEKTIENPDLGASYDELLTDVSIRIIERKYKDAIENGANEIDAYDAVIEEIGQDDFEGLLPGMQKYLEGEKTLEEATTTTPQLDRAEIEEAVQRMAPIQKKSGEVVGLPDDIYQEYQENGEQLIGDNKEIDEPQKEDATLKDILERLTQIREEQQRAIEEQKDKEPNIRIDPNVFVNVNNSKKDKNVDKHKIININIDRSKHIDNSDHSVHNHYDEKDKDKDTEEPKDYHGKDGKDGNDGNNGSNGNDGKNGKNGKDGKEPEPIAPEPPKVEPVTIVEPVEKPKKEPKETEPIQPEPVDPIIDPTIIGVGGKQEVEKPKEDKPIEKPEDEVQKQDEEPKVEENTKDNPNVVINGDVHIHNGDNNVTQINEDIDITQNNIEINNIEEQNNNTIHVHYHDGRPDEVIDITEDVEPVQKEMDVIEAEVIEQPQIEGEELKQLPYGGEQIEVENEPVLSDEEKAKQIHEYFNENFDEIKDDINDRIDKLREKLKEQKLEDSLIEEKVEEAQSQMAMKLTQFMSDIEKIRNNALEDVSKNFNLEDAYEKVKALKEEKERKEKQLEEIKESNLDTRLEGIESQAGYIEEKAKNEKEKKDEQPGIK